MIRSCCGGGGPRSTGRPAARLSTAVTVSPGPSGALGGTASAADVGGSVPPVLAPVGADASASTSAGGPDAGRTGGRDGSSRTAAVATRARSGVRPPEVPCTTRNTVAGTGVDGSGADREAARAPAEAEFGGAGLACGEDDGDVRAGRVGTAVEGPPGRGSAGRVGRGTADGRGRGIADGRGSAVGKPRGTDTCTSTRSGTRTVMVLGEVLTSSGWRLVGNGSGVSAWAGLAPRAAPSAAAPIAAAGRLCLNRIRRRPSTGAPRARPGPIHRCAAAGRADARRVLPFPPCAGSCPGNPRATPSVDVWVAGSRVRPGSGRLDVSDRVGGSHPGFRWGRGGVERQVTHPADRGGQIDDRGERGERPEDQQGGAGAERPGQDAGE